MLRFDLWVEYSIVQESNVVTMKEYNHAYLYQRIVKAKMYIDQHAIENIDLDNIANTACFSKSHFIRLFRKGYGSTPHLYLIKKRIAIAKLQLEDQHPVREVCWKVGFESTTYFSAVFRKHTGITPAIFRRNAGLKRKAIKDAPLGFIPSCFAEKNGWDEKGNFQ